MITAMEEADDTFHLVTMSCTDCTLYTGTPRESNLAV